MATAVDAFGRLDIAVANAAFSIREPVVEAAWEHVERTFAVTQFGVFHTCQAAARQLVAQGRGGKIVIIGSIMAEMALPNSSAYEMAKAATALTLSKNYVQDQPLRWGLLSPAKSTETPGPHGNQAGRDAALETGPDRR